MNLNLQKLKEYGHKVLNCHGEITDLKLEKIDGGKSSAEVNRIILTFEGCSRTLILVQKLTFPNEVEVMLALSELQNVPSLPELIDYAWNPASNKKSVNWFISPFYNGTPLTFEDEVPEDVIQALVSLHHRYQNQTERFTSLHRVNSSSFGNTLANAVEAIEEAARETQNSIFEKELEHLRKTRQNEQIFQALQRLPVTLTHGDMHPTNMIHQQNGETILLDWGNARIAPAMLDIANLIEIGSQGWQTYLDAWQEVSGEAMDLRLAQLGYHWATIMVNSMYLPYAVWHSTLEHVGRMVGKVVEAEQFISGLFQQEKACCNS